MKIYRIKAKDGSFYVKGILFDTTSEDLKLQIIPAFTIDDAAWYEEDKAIKYCESLNEQNEGITFIMEEVIRDGR